MPVSAMRCGLVGSIGLLLVCVAAALPWSVQLARYWRNLNRGPYTRPQVAFTGDSRNLQQSVVVPTLDSPLPEGKNVIWCASFQMAWDRLKDDVAGGPVRVENAEALATRLNHSIVSASTLPDDSTYAAAGFVKDGIVDTIRREMQSRFDKEPADLDAAGNVIVAYAYLRANVPFTMPYFDNDEEFLFTDGQGHKTAISSFGLRPKDTSAYSDLRRQVAILYARSCGGRRFPSTRRSLSADGVRPRLVPRVEPQSSHRGLRATARDAAGHAAIHGTEDRGAAIEGLSAAASWPTTHICSCPTCIGASVTHFAELEGLRQAVAQSRVQGGVHQQGHADDRLPLGP